MAAISSSKSRVILFFLFLFFFACSLLNVIEAGFGTRLGGKSEIKDVKNNKQVQELGRYCVEKYNLEPQNEIGKLKFLQVVKGQQQVVSGIKYYLKISAAPASSTATTTTATTTTTDQKGGVQQQQKMFEAVVVVKAWVPSKELLEFSPSTQ